VTATAITIGIVCRYPYRCCCHHQRRSSCRHPCPDVSIVPDAPAAPPLPTSFVMDPTAVQLRLAMVPHQRRRRRRRRSATDATAPTPDAAWTTPSSAWRTGSSSARSSRQWRRGAAAAESGDCDDIDDCDRHRRVVHWAGGSKAMTAAALRRRMTTKPTWKRGGTRAISRRSSSADFGKGVLGGGEQQRRQRK
jgi:hypothetical protein